MIAAFSHGALSYDDVLHMTGEDRVLFFKEVEKYRKDGYFNII